MKLHCAVFAAALLLFACQSTSDSEAPRATDAHARAGSADRSLARLLPAPRSALKIDAAPLPLDELLLKLANSTGLTFSIDEISMRPMLRETRLSLSQPVVVQPADAYTWVESQLLERGYFLTCDPNVRPTLVSVHTSRRTGTNDLVSIAAGPEDLDFLRAHPAFHFTVTASFDHLDVRTAPSTLRPLLPSGDTSSVLPILHTSSVIVRGTGRFVVQILEVLEKAEAEAARDLAPGHMGPVEPRESKR